MLTAAIKEKMVGWNKELDEIRERINSLNGAKREGQTAVQAALKGRNAEELVSARADLARVNEEIEALKLIEVEIAKSHPVGHETFRQEYAEFFAQQMQILNKAYRDIADQLSKLDTDLYYNYDQAYQQYVAQLKPWQNLAEKIGVDRPAEFRSQILNPAHGDIKRALAKLRVTGGI